MRYLWSGDWDIRKYCENQMWGTQHRTPEMIFHLAESGGETFPWLPGGESLSWAGSNGNWSWKEPCPEGAVHLSCGEKLKTLEHLLPCPKEGQGKQPMFPNTSSGSAWNGKNISSEMSVAPVPPVPLCACWRAQECVLQVKPPLALPKKKIPRRFNKASGAERAAELWQQFISCE